MTPESTKRGFDCVAFQREQRERLGKELEGMDCLDVGPFTSQSR